MPTPITRIPTDDAALRQAHTEELRNYVEQALSEQFAGLHPDLLIDVAVARRSDYDEVKVFLTKARLVEEVKSFLADLEQSLAEKGIPTLMYVRTWTSPRP